MHSPPRPTRVGLISLGCAKNLVDAEIMLGALLKGGVQIVSNPAEADAVIVNTCSFIDAAQEESVDAILESDAIRQASNRGQALIVSGCLPQRFRDELPRLLPEVDAFMGVDQVADVGAIVAKAIGQRARKEQSLKPGAQRRKKISAQLAKVASGQPHDTHAPGEGLKVTPPSPAPPPPLVEVNQRPSYIPDFATPRLRLTPKHLAYVKIAEGCNHPCSFCIIPRMRGAHRSRPQPDIVQEARQLIAAGTRELNLISQDSTYYGLDLRPRRDGSIASPEKFNAAARALPTDSATLCTLLRELNDLPGDFWIRLLYTHPAHWTDELIHTIAACPKVPRYVDMPLQHIHDNMLERMRRETSREYIVDLIRRIRAGIPGIAIRTTFIVGFPGETPEYFRSLLEFIHDTRFERLGIFSYSREEGTRAARMGCQLPDATKELRRELAMAAQLEVAREVSNSFVGRTIRVLVEKKAAAHELNNANVSSWEHGLIRQPDGYAEKLKGRYLVARGEADAPDIDGRVYVRGNLPLGEFARVRVIGHTDYDLIAEPA